MSSHEPDSSDPSTESGGTSLATWLAYAAFVGLTVTFLAVVLKQDRAPVVPAPLTINQPAPMVVRPPLQPEPILETNQVVGVPMSDAPPYLRLSSVKNFWDQDIELTFWWAPVAESIRQTRLDTGDESNIKHQDYAGAKACIECHEEKYNDWYDHAHRRMNAVADIENVVGDFSGKTGIEYLGGHGRFFQKEGNYYMELERSTNRHTYQVIRTIGSRFFQYYVGRMIDSTQPISNEKRTIDHVLPFGYWIDHQEWVPTVHVSSSDRNAELSDDPYNQSKVVDYDWSCSDCHATWAYGDWVTRSGGSLRTKSYSPRTFDFAMREYVQGSHPELNAVSKPFQNYTRKEVVTFADSLNNLPAPTKAVNLGISCEACHNGCKEHIAASTKTKSDKLPAFFPVSPLVHTEAGSYEEMRGRNTPNLTYVCAKCHTGNRPKYANGTHTWNSTEFSDSIAGYCYNIPEAKKRGMENLTCVHCHDPHETIGRKWKPTPQQNDQKCLHCHQEFRGESALTAHTHHAADSAGSHCMDCHMPKINEGLQDMVRTHRIFHPTDRAMIEANQPNACNLCHLDKPIDWTVKHLREWYGNQHVYEDGKIAANYPNRSGPVGPGWLKSPHPPTRLSAASAIAKSPYAPEMLEELLQLLIDDESLINRQFTQESIEGWLGIDLRDKGFRFYMNLEQRTAAIDKSRDALAELVAKRK
jgi:hypothetical protein